MANRGHSSIAVAEYILRKAASQPEYNSLTPMQLLKLVYMAHGWMLGLHGRPLINETVEAWRYGPVIPNLYQKIRKFRSSPVAFPLDSNYNEQEFDQLEKDLMDQVVAIYSKYTGLDLSRLTHDGDTPWSRIWAYGGKNAVISNDLIEDHYSYLYQKYTENQAQQQAQAQ